ncbi:MAG: hypothetical protein AABW55_03265, partial [Thermoproteota archaeon]
MDDEYYKLQVYGPEWGAGEDWDQESINLVFPRVYARHYHELDKVFKQSIYQQLGLFGRPRPAVKFLGIKKVVDA